MSWLSRYAAVVPFSRPLFELIPYLRTGHHRAAPNSTGGPCPGLSPPSGTPPWSKPRSWSLTKRGERGRRGRGGGGGRCRVTFGKNHQSKMRDLPFVSPIADRSRAVYAASCPSPPCLVPKQLQVLPVSPLSFLYLSSPLCLASFFGFWYTLTEVETAAHRFATSLRGSAGTWRV